MSLNPATAIRFVKAEANGNDFLIVDADAIAPAQRAHFARRICDRHRGIGADGVEFVRSQGERFELALFNADGGEAEISGNGTRCVAAFYARRGFREGTFQTGAGARPAHVAAGQHDHWSIELDMGAPEIEGAATIEALGRETAVTILSMGNPQCVALVPEFPRDWQVLGKALEAHPRFPHGANVEFARVRDRHRLEIRIYERGVGPTHSSGTGSCAAAVAAIVNGVADSPVEVISPGGAQRVTWQGGENTVKLLGPARIVAEGVFFFSFENLPQEL